MQLLKKLNAILLVSILVVAGCDQPSSVQKENTEITPSKSQSARKKQKKYGQPIPGQYIVVYKSGKAKTPLSARNAHSQTRAIQAEYHIPQSSMKSTYNHSIRGFAAKLDHHQLTQLKKDDRIDYVEQDRIITLSPPCGTPKGGPCDGGGSGGSTNQTVPYGITRVGGPTASSGTAWVIDTGVDLDHPDLNVDVSRSAEFVSNGKGSKTVDDGNGHGTHVSGTIAALDNDIDVVGVAAGATIVAVKVLNDRGSGSYSDIIDGIDYVAANAAPGDAANMSLGGGTSQAVDDAVRNAADKGVYFAIAAGNDSDDANNHSPARVEYPNVWTVSAIDNTDTFASFSNYSGPTDPPIEFAAPGVDVFSLWKNGGTNTISGTSMATPHVAGVLLVTGGNPNSDGTAASDPDGDPDPIVHN